MSECALDALDRLDRERLQAVRRGDLARLAVLETRRRELLDGLERGALAGLAQRQPESLRERLRQILVNDRAVQTALRLRMEANRAARRRMEKQRQAERAYRKQ